MGIAFTNIGIESSFINWITTFSHHNKLSLESSVRTGSYFYFSIIFGRILGIFL